jgi:hypothetical protein
MSEAALIMSLTAMDSNAAPETGASNSFTPVAPPRADDHPAIPPGSRRPRWLPQRVGSIVRPAPTPSRRPVTGPPLLLAQRMLVHCAPGTELDAVLPHIDNEISGLVLTAGRFGPARLSEIIHELPKRGFDGPVVFDAEAYRKRAASDGGALLLEGPDPLSALNAALERQIELGATIATTPTLYIRPDNLDAFARAVELANRLDRDDYLLTAPVDATVLDTGAARNQLETILDAAHAPIGFILGSQFDPFGTRSTDRVLAARALLATRANVMPIRTDFAAFDWMAHGAYAAAIGTGSSKRHAIDPEERGHVRNPKDNSPSVLYPRLLSHWKGRKIADTHGRLPAETCWCGGCDGQNMARFVSPSYLPDARAHGVAVWQDMARLMMSTPSRATWAQFWKGRARDALDQHDILATQLRHTPPFVPQPALRAWATLPA